MDNESKALLWEDIIYFYTSLDRSITFHKIMSNAPNLAVTVVISPLSQIKCFESNIMSGTNRQIVILNDFGVDKSSAQIR